MLVGGVGRLRVARRPCAGTEFVRPLCLLRRQQLWCFSSSWASVISLLGGHEEWLPKYAEQARSGVSSSYSPEVDTVARRPVFEGAVALCGLR